MYKKDYSQSVLYGFSRLAWRVDQVEKTVKMLESGEGSRIDCLLTLPSSIAAVAMVEYFKNGSLASFKQLSHVAAKIRIIRQHEIPDHHYLTEDLIWALLSDDEFLIDWYRQVDAMYYPEKPSISGGDKDNPKSWMYYRYQFWLALNARWDELGDRCERILAIQDEIKKDRSYIIDHRFYLALARSDRESMKTVLLEKCDPRHRKSRYDQESGLTNNFIVSYATLFAKLAWRHGYELDLDTPWIPREWLPIRPNYSYEDPWPFMKDFDIWKPFKEPWTKYSPSRPAP